MKNEKRNTPTFKSFLLLTVFISFFSGLGAQVEYKEVLKFEADVNPNVIVSFTNRSHDAEIKTWDNEAIELQLDVKIKAKKQEDIDVTLDALKSIEFKDGGSKFFINTTFWESMKSNTNYKFSLINGKTVNLRDFSISITMYVPKTISMEMDCKYADINMDEISGKFDLTMFSGKLYAESFGGTADFNLKYSKVFLGSIPQANAVLFDSDINMQTCGNLVLKSKYSKIEIENTGDFNFESFDDNITIARLGKIKGEAKYSDFDFGPSVNLNFNFYDCNLKGGDTGDVTGKSKYTEIELKNVENVNLESSFDDTYILGDIDSFACGESKYSDFDIEFLNNSFTLKSYDDNVKIAELATGFTEVSIEGKYGDFRMQLPESAQCQLLVDMKYGRVDYPEKMFTRKTYIKDNSELFIDAKTKNTVGQPSSIIEIKGHDNKLVLDD